MNDLDNLRKEIDEIDEQIKKLFVKRMAVVKSINDVKKTLGISVIDLKREREILSKINDIEDENIKNLYLELLKRILDLSKKYQELL